MARKTKNSKNRKKTGTSAPQLDPSRLFFHQYPLEQLCENWVHQLENRLAAAGADDAAALSAELERERQAWESMQKAEALLNTYFLEHRTEEEEKEGEGEEQGAALPTDDPDMEHNPSMDQMKPRAGDVSVIHRYVLGSLLQKVAMLDDSQEDSQEDSLDDSQDDGQKDSQEDSQKKKTTREDVLQMAKKYLTFAAERGFTPAYYDLVVWYRNNGDSDTANQWFARALEAGEPPALLEEGMMLLKLQPLAPEELQARLDQLYNLALNHCWNALELLCIICKLRMANETVKAFAPRPLRLLQGLARQGFALAMLALGDYYNTIMLAPDAAHRDNKVHYWYDMAAEHGLDEGLIRSIRAGFFGPVYNRGLYMRP